MTTRFTIYCHTNRVNGKNYVGQTLYSMEKRWRDHISQSKSGRMDRYSPVFHAAIRKYGPEAFDHRQLEIVFTKAEADLAETYWVKQLNCRVPFGYNVAAGGQGPGYHHEDTKRLIGQASKLWWQAMTAEERSARQKACWSPERLIRAKSIVVSEAHRAKIGEAARKRLAGMTPEQRTEFFKKNIHIYTPERLARHAERFRSKEHREKVAAIQKDFWSKLSPEERLARAKHMHAGISEEKKHERTHKAWAKLTPEKRAERIRNASEANVRAWSPERSKKRSEAQSARHAAIPPEQRREVVNKAWVTRRAKYGQSGMKNPAPARSGYVKLTPEELSKRRRKSWANMTPEAYDERVRKTREGKRLARLAKSGQQLDAELVPFVQHWHKRGHSIRSIALAFDVSTNEIERAVA